MEEQRGSYRILGAEGPAESLWYAELGGRLRHAAGEPGSETLRPCVGDWVMALVPSGAGGDGGGNGGGVARIDRVLARRTKFSRQAPGGRTAEQIIAAN